MTQKLVDTITNERVKKWYENDRFVNLNSVQNEIGPEYTFLTDEGIFIGQALSEDITKVKLVFPRPTDIHYHTDITENFKVISGIGSLFTFYSLNNKLVSWLPSKMERGKKLTVSKNVSHSLVPILGNHLEILLTCDGKLKEKNEITVKTFDEVEYEGWLERSIPY